MSQPPYPPHGGNDAGGERSVPQDWDPAVGADDPTRKFAAPGAGQRDATRQFGQPEYAQPPYGQAPYGQPSHPQYGQSPYPRYGAPQYPPPQYGSAPYGQPQYAPSPYGRPWGPPGGPGAPPPKSRRNTVIALMTGAVVLLVAIGVGLFFLLRAGDPGPRASASSGPSGATAGPSELAPTDERGIPNATVRPDGLGDDPDLDELAQECYDGDMGSCDRLYEEAELDSLYGLYGGTCAGRQDVSYADTVFCDDAFPEN